MLKIGSPHTDRNKIVSPPNDKLIALVQKTLRISV